MNRVKRSHSLPEGTELHVSPFGKRHIGLLVVFVVSFAVLFSAHLTRHAYFSAPLYELGDIAHTEIIIPMDMLIEDEAVTAARRAEAKSKAIPVYRFNPSLPDEQAARVRAAFSQSRVLLGFNGASGKSSGRSHRLSFRTLPPDVKVRLRAAMESLGIKQPADDLLTFLVREGFPSRLEDVIIRLHQDVFLTLLIVDEMPSTKGKESIHKLNVVTGKTETIPMNLLSTLAHAHSRADQQIHQDRRVAIASRPYVGRILESLIIPNLTFDASLTKSREEEEIKNVDPVLRKLKKGKVVLRQGDEVGEDHLVQIDAIRKLSPQVAPIVQTAGMVFLVGILLTLFVFFVRFIAVPQWNYPRLVGFLLLTLTVNLLVVDVSWFVCEAISQSFLAPPFNDKPYFFYLLPFAFGSMLTTLLAGERCAQMFIIFFCILAGQSVGADYYGFFYILMANLIGILAMRKVQQRIGMIGAGLKLGMAAVVLFIILHVAKQQTVDLISVGFGAALAFLSGILNAILLVFTLPLCERIFMVTTEIRLSELGNLNLPLIRELILKAPGTYNHSIAVGTLCEGAARAIGLNPLFLRIASLYHDIGKTVRPEYFVENQQGENPHDKIGARESVPILQGHVTDGIRITKKEHLPPSIVDMIPQHHGTRLMHFFYEKAKHEASASGESVQEDQFRYTGPKPQTKEAAIVMLADGIESAARTLNDRSQSVLLALIRKIIADTTEDGQFSECDITFSEMDRIASRFLDTLCSYYHGRIPYPGLYVNNVSQEENASENNREVYNRSDNSS